MTTILNKKILLSLGMIVFVAAAIVGATGAFFSDTETSTGNTFTAGAIDLRVDSQQHYNGHECIENDGGGEDAPYFVWGPGANPYPETGTPCGGTWGQENGGEDLTNQKFFNFDDIKPGDEGENTISLHVINNDAYVCAEVSNLASNDNGLTEPEGLVDTTDGAGNGELDNEMVWNVWRDNGEGGGVAGDNIKNGTEQTLTSGNPTNGVLALYDSTTGAPLAGGDTAYIGVSWSLPAASGNETQTDSLTGDISFQVVQSRNNGGFVCGQSQTPERPVVGALLSAYVAPASTACDVTVDDSIVGPLDTIQEGINTATTGQTVCVAAGSYTEDVNINKSLTLAGAGAGSTVLTGVGTGFGGALTVASGIDNVTIKGLGIIGTGESAVYLTSNNDNIDVLYNRIVAATAKNALLTGGQQTNSTLSNNVFEGNAAGSQLVYVNGSASLGGANASDNVDFLNNTFGGSGNLALGQEAGNSSVTQNKFSTVTSFTDVEDWKGGNNYNQNNFNDGGLNLQHSENGSTGDNGITNAENNWWGDINPADGDVNANVDVDFTPSEVAAFPQN